MLHAMVTRSPDSVGHVAPCDVIFFSVYRKPNFNPLQLSEIVLLGRVSMIQQKHKRKHVGESGNGECNANALVACNFEEKEIQIFKAKVGMFVILFCI